MRYHVKYLLILFSLIYLSNLADSDVTDVFDNRPESDIRSGGGHSANPLYTSDFNGITIIKYAKNENHFLPGQQITIRIEIYNNNMNNKIKDVQLEQELSKNVGFYANSYYPQNNYIVDKEYDSNKLKWTIGEIYSIAKIEFNISFRKSGKYILSPTILKAKKIDKSVESAITSCSAPIYIDVSNNAPIVENINFPPSPLWKDDQRILHANITDRDGDDIICSLYSNRIGYIKDKNNFTLKNKTNQSHKFYEWDLSKCNPGKHTLSLITTDGKDTSVREAELEIKDYWGYGPIRIPEEYVWLVFAVAFLTGLFDKFFGSYIVNKIYSNILDQTKRFFVFFIKYFF